MREENRKKKGREEVSSLVGNAIKSRYSGESSCGSGKGKWGGRKKGGEKGEDSTRRKTSLTRSLALKYGGSVSASKLEKRKKEEGEKRAPTFGSISVEPRLRTYTPPDTPAPGGTRKKERGEGRHASCAVVTQNPLCRRQPGEQREGGQDTERKERRKKEKGEWRRWRLKGRL